jgi:hypothetical protein
MTRIATISAVLAVVMVAAAPRPAAAGVSIGVDGNLTKLVGDGSGGFDAGWGIGVRGGYELPIPILTIDVGAMFRYARFPATVGGGELSSRDVMVGGRAAIGAFFKPFARFYIGYGNLAYETGGISSSQGGTALLIGGGLDFGFQAASLGVHLDYNKDVVDTPNGQAAPTEWLALGADLTIAF